MRKVRSDIKSAILTVLLLIPVGAHAQGPGFGGDVEDTPIDGGATTLLVAVVGYGVKKLAVKKTKR